MYKYIFEAIVESSKPLTNEDVQDGIEAGFKEMTDLTIHSASVQDLPALVR